MINNNILLLEVVYSVGLSQVLEHKYLHNIDCVFGTMEETDKETPLKYQCAEFSKLLSFRVYNNICCTYAGSL